MGRRSTKPSPKHQFFAFLASILWGACALMPQKPRWYVGSVLGKLLYWLAPKRREIVLRNLELCFPEQSEPARRQLASQVFRNAALGVLSWGLALFASDRRIEKEISWYGRETMEGFLETNQSVILLSPHFVAPLMLVRSIGLLTPLVAMYYPPVNPVIDMTYHCALEGRQSPYRWVNWMYAKRGKNSIQMRSSRGSMRPFYDALKHGLPFFYLPDQNAKIEAHTVFAPFFGIEAATYTALTRFAQYRNSRIILCYGLIRPDGKGFDLHTEMLPQNFVMGDVQKDAIRLNQMIENLVRRAPDQYFWLHRRFKTRPEGEAPIY